MECKVPLAIEVINFFYIHEQLQLNEYQTRPQVDLLSISEKRKLKNIIDGKNQQLDACRIETESLSEQAAFHRREVSF